jgi:hypothetical protein
VATTSRARITKLRADRRVPLTALETDARFYETERGRGRVYPSVDESPGVYAAWLEHPEALREAGVDAKPPLALYVGKAVQRKGLSQRLGVHVDVPWLELIELLALAWAGGGVLSPFGGRVGRLDWEEARRELDPMTTRARRSARDSLHDSVVWSWITCPKEDARQLEQEAIRSLKPLLNIAEMPRYPPPLMRPPIHPRIRAQWLWHMSWAGLLLAPKPARLSAAQRSTGGSPTPTRATRPMTLGFQSPTSTDRSTGSRLGDPSARRGMTYGSSS